MSALGWDKRGASSSLQFGISPYPKADPGFYLLWETITDFRAHATYQYAFATIDRLAEVLPKQLPQGPCAAVINQFHLVGWRWDGDGYIVDHESLCWSVFGSSIQWVFFRLVHAWAAYTGGFLQTRPGFSGLGDVDRTTTFAKFNTWTVEQRGVLRAAMNGTFYTNDALVHAGHVDTKSCPFCGAQDSKYHRMWECSHFADLRCKIPRHIQEELLETPDCCHVHGWMVEHSDVKQFRLALQSIPDTSRIISGDVPAGTLQLFTDGACLAPTVPGARLGTWAVCAGDLSNDTFPVLMTGGLPLGCQTALRGELTAAIAAIGCALQHHRDFILWLDNQTVYSFLVQCRDGTAKPKSTRKKDHDLWNKLHGLASHAVREQKFLGAVKVQSHATIMEDTPAIDAWAFRGNQAADSAAAGTVHTLPKRVVQFQERARLALERVGELRDHLHTFLVDVGTRAVSQPKPDDIEPQCPVAVPKPREGETRVSFEPFPNEVTEVPSAMGDIATRVMSWLRQIVTHDEAEPRWITSYHLLAHFQMVTKCHGYRYLPKLKKWEVITDFDDCDGPMFLRCSRWF